MSGIKEAIEGASAYLREHPEEASYTDSIAKAVLGDRLRVRVTGTTGEEVSTDMPGAVGGQGELPSPGWYLRAAVASCSAALIAMRAAQEGVDLSSLEVDVDSESNDYGILGLDDETPAGPLSMRIAVRVSADADDAKVREISEWAIEHCPVSDAVKRAVDISLDLEQA